MKNFCYLKDTAKSMKSQATNWKKSYLQNTYLIKDYIQNKQKSYNNPIKRGQGKTFEKTLHQRDTYTGSRQRYLTCH